MISETKLNIPIIRIEPSRGWVALNLSELWAYRELLYFLTWRDVKVKYKQTIIGAGWAILQPLMTMMVFTLVFKKIADISSEGIPYPIFAYTALLPWNLFAGALNRSAGSLVGQVGLISKVYFPRLIIPLSATIAGIIDFAIAFVILVGMMFWYGVTPRLAALSLPLFITIALVAALAVGLWLAALTIGALAIPSLSRFPVPHSIVGIVFLPLAVFVTVFLAAVAALVALCSFRRCSPCGLWSTSS